MSPGPKVARDKPAMVGTCASCGRPLTQVGPKGECLRCLADLGFLSDSQEPEKSGTHRRLTPGPLKYDHFEVEVGPDGFPVELGAGAMAVTYRARDTVLNSVVALKVIDRRAAQNPGARSRFLREARAAAQIQHRNVARVTHYGEQNGECFYAMELIHGETLEARVRRDGPLPLALALEIIEQVARALAAAEACGVVHRDIKPSNIMLKSDVTDTLVVKVIDYGVAKVLSPQGVAAEQTQTGFIGTPSFASPEQFASVGHSQIDTRSDIYSLGITFWYLLCGRVPFIGRTLDEIRIRQTEELPFKELKGLHIPASCLLLLKSMLAVDPARRPQSARELLTNVRSCFIRFEPSARRRRKRVVMIGGVVSLTIALAVVAGFTYFRRQLSPELDRGIAVLPFENLSANGEDQFFAVGMQDEVLTKLASRADLKVISRTSTEKYKSRPPNIKTVGQELGVGRILEGSVQRSGERVRVNVQLIDVRTDTHLWANTYDRTFDDAFDVETEVANAVAAQLNPNFAQKIVSKRPTQNAAAYQAYLRGIGLEHSQANTSSARDAAAAYAEAVALDPNFALAWARLTLVRSFLYVNGVDRNANSATTVREGADRALELAPNNGETWLAQGQYRASVLRDRPAALQAYHEAGKYLPNSALVYDNMCALEIRMGRWREAEAHLLRAVELDPRDVRLWTKTAVNLYSALSRYAEAQSAVDRALEISPGDDEAITAKADLFQNQGQLDQAAKWLARIPKDSTNAYAINLRAWQAMDERKFDEAVYWTQQLTKDLKPGQPLSFLATFALLHQGYFQEWAGHPDEARATFQRVIHEIMPTPGSVITGGRETRSLLAMAYAGLGDNAKALEQAQQAVADFANDAYLGPTTEKYLSRVQARCGEIDAAVITVAHLLEVPNGTGVAALGLSPFYDPLRKNARFQELLKHPPSVRY